MTTGIEPSVNRFLMDLNNIQARIDRAGREIGSGKRVSAPSDDPAHVQELLVTRAALDRTTQLKMSLGLAKDEVDTAEQALESAVTVLDRAATAGSEGAGTLTTPEQRAVLADQVQAALEQLVSLANTNLGGRYVFSGDSDLTAPYALNPDQPNGVDPYAGSAVTRMIQHPAGSTFTIAKTAQEIFDNADPAKNAFAVLNRLREALATPAADQEQAIADALANVRAARDHVNRELSSYGVTQNRLDEAIAFAHKLELRQTSALSDLQDADLTASILAFSQATQQQQAALAARAQLPRGSLFDFLG